MLSYCLLAVLHFHFLARYPFSCLRNCVDQAGRTTHLSRGLLERERDLERSLLRASRSGLLSRRSIQKQKLKYKEVLL